MSRIRALLAISALLCLCNACSDDPAEPLLRAGPRPPMGTPSNGEAHVCADGPDGRAYCWGSNRNGQLGVGRVVMCPLPYDQWSACEYSDTALLVQAPPGVTLSRPVAGYHHSCAEGSDGRAYCWGWNSLGQTGAGLSEAVRSPFAVLAPDGVTLTRLAAGQHHTCAEGSDGNGYCWGYGTDSQLGRVPTAIRVEPLPVTSPPGVQLYGFAAGGFHTCAQGTNGKAYCWGQRYEGQLGYTPVTWRSSWQPVAVAAPEGVVLSRLTTGEAHTCAQGSDGRAYCWGRNTDGQLGDGSTTSRETPVAVASPPGVVFLRLIARTTYTCAQASNAKVYCWGRFLGVVPTVTSNPPVLF